MSTPLPDSTQTRQAMIDACLWMNARGLNLGASGNISVRVQEGILITPSGVAYDQITPDRIVSLPLAGAPDPATGDRPSSEWPFHQRLHQSRPDMPVVLHAHPPHCSAVAIQRRGIPACHYMVAAFGGHDVPLAGYALYGSDALSEALARALAARHGCLMANHGATVLGEDIARACWRLEELENLARIYLLSHQGGAPHILSNAEMAEVLDKFPQYRPAAPAG